MSLSPQKLLLISTLLLCVTSVLPAGADSVFSGGSWLRDSEIDWSASRSKSDVQRLAEEARNGDVKAMRRLGIISMKGIKVKPSAKIAIKWWKMAAEEGDAHSMMYLGDVYKGGNGVRKDAKRALQYYADALEAAEEKSNTVADDNHVIIKRIKKLPLSVTINWWKERCEDGDSHAMYYLATLEASKRKGLLTDEDAEEYLQQAAEAGHVEAKKKVQSLASKQGKAQEGGDNLEDNASLAEDTSDTKEEQGKAGQQSGHIAGGRNVVADANVSPDDKATQSEEKSNEQIIAEIKRMSSEDQYSHMERWMERNDLSSFKQSLDAGVPVDLAYKGLKRMCVDAAQSWLNAQLVEEMLRPYDVRLELTQNDGNPFNYDVTLLHVAAQNERIEFVRELISRGANVNAQTNFGETPLYYAALTGNLEIVKMLLAAGAEYSLHTSIYSDQKMRARDVLLREVHNLDRFLNDRTSVVSPTGAYRTIAKMARSGAFRDDVRLYILEYLDSIEKRKEVAQQELLAEEEYTENVEEASEVVKIRKREKSYSHWVYIGAAIVILAAVTLVGLLRIKRSKVRKDKQSVSNNVELIPSPDELTAAAPHISPNPINMKQYYICKPGGTQEGPYPEDMVRTCHEQGIFPADTLIWFDGAEEWMAIQNVFGEPKASAPAQALQPQEAVLQVPMPPTPQSPAPTPYPAPPAPPQEEPTYYVALPGAQPQGPYTKSAIIVEYYNGAYSPDTKVWGPDTGTWIPVGNIVRPVATPKFGAVMAHIQNGAKAKNWNPLTAFVSCMKRYAQFSGRSSRSEFWYYMLAQCILVLLIVCICLVVGALVSIADDDLAAILASTVWYILVGVLSLGTFIPSLALGMRRTQDAGYPGALYCLVFIPIVGSIAGIVIGCLPSKNENNPHGPSPLLPL